LSIPAVSSAAVETVYLADPTPAKTALIPARLVGGEGRAFMSAATMIMIAEQAGGAFIVGV
jgi:hypothetical protein